MNIYEFVDIHENGRSPSTGEVFWLKCSVSGYLENAPYLPFHGEYASSNLAGDAKHNKHLEGGSFWAPFFVAFSGQKVLKFIDIIMAFEGFHHMAGVGVKISLGCRQV